MATRSPIIDVHGRQAHAFVPGAWNYSRQAAGGKPFLHGLCGEEQQPGRWAQPRSQFRQCVSRMLRVTIALIQEVELVGLLAQRLAQFINPKEDAWINGLQRNWGKDRHVSAGCGQSRAGVGLGDEVALAFTSANQAFVRKSCQSGAQGHPAHAELAAQFPLAGQAITDGTGADMLFQDRDRLGNQGQSFGRT